MSFLIYIVMMLKLIGAYLNTTYMRARKDPIDVYWGGLREREEIIIMTYVMINDVGAKVVPKNDARISRVQVLTCKNMVGATLNHNTNISIIWPLDVVKHDMIGLFGIQETHITISHDEAMLMRHLLCANRIDHLENGKLVDVKPWRTNMFVFIKWENMKR